VALPADIPSLIEIARNGDRRALARLLSIVEDDRSGAASVMQQVYPASGAAYRIGLTGAPGAGKSTLTDRLIGRLRRDDVEVGVLAVDPTSPFSGGAVLGDRVRMQDWVLDTGVFVRSMASRGHLGGLSAAAPKALTLLDAAGFAYLLIETVGVGQDEVEIVRAADTTIVALTPGWGDGIQAAKAGILEIGDVFAVNKADRPGVDDTIRDLKTMLAMGPERPWTPPIIPTIGVSGEGIDELWDAIDGHRRHLAESGGLDEGRRDRRVGELEVALAAVFARRAESLAKDPEGRELVARVERGELDPWSAAEELIAVPER